MTLKEVRNHPEYKKAVQKIKDYQKDFEFTLNYESIPTAKLNALKIVLQDCIKNNLLESISMTLALNGTITSETFKKL